MFLDILWVHFGTQQLAVTHPEKVNRLVLIAASCGGKESIPQSPQLRKMAVGVMNKIANDTPVTQQGWKGFLSPSLRIWMAQTASQFP